MKGINNRSINKVGKFGFYKGESYKDGGKTIAVFLTNNTPTVNKTSGTIVIADDDIAPFVTELIEMARVLGVTGQEKGNE